MNENRDESSMRELTREIAASAWCQPTTSHKVMDVELANAFSDILYNIMTQAEDMVGQAFEESEEYSKEVDVRIKAAEDIVNGAKSLLNEMEGACCDNNINISQDEAREILRAFSECEATDYDSAVEMQSVQDKILSLYPELRVNKNEDKPTLKNCRLMSNEEIMKEFMEVKKDTNTQPCLPKDAEIVVGSPYGSKSIKISTVNKGDDIKVGSPYGPESKSYEFKTPSGHRIVFYDREDKMATEIAKLDKITIPLIRHQYPQLIADKLVEPKKKSESYETKYTKGFETFFNHDEIVELSNKAENVIELDWNKLLGDTIKERYESLYLVVLNLTKDLSKDDPKKRTSWIVTSPELASIFETATAGFSPAGSYDETNKVLFAGTINGRWYLYKDYEIDKNIILIGHDNYERDPKHYARIVVNNFI